ncbi:MAG: hypothetical protein HGA85_04570 [Nanoarchaeota archaeon]|nr:hypothetical protein [Nanoarchaeota archaeon]
MRKKGVSQLDWIMSLAIFLLYLIWFFSFLMPRAVFTTGKDAYISVLQDKFEEEFTDEDSRLPLFLFTNNSGTYVSIVNYTRNETMMFEDGEDFIIWNGKMIFLANISPEKKVWWLVPGTDTEDNHSEIDVEDDSVSITDMTVRLDESMPDRASYIDRERFEVISYTMNGVTFNPENSSYNKTGLAAFYMAERQNINHTSVIVEGASEINNFITYADYGGTYQFEIYLDLYRYDEYRSDNINYGELPHDDAVVNVDYYSDVLRLYDDESSLYIYFDREAHINITDYNSTLTLKLTIPVSGNTHYKYVFDTSERDRDEYKYAFGLEDIKYSINLSRIDTNYSYYKQRWRIPEERDFVIFLYENTSELSLDDPYMQLGTYDPGLKPVFAQSKVSRSFEGPVRVRYLIW